MDLNMLSGWLMMFNGFSMNEDWILAVAVMVIDKVRDWSPCFGVSELWIVGRASAVIDKKTVPSVMMGRGEPLLLRMVGIV